MGVNIPDIKYIIHFGPPKDVEDYVQAVGRAGCDLAVMEHKLLPFFILLEIFLENVPLK